MDDLYKSFPENFYHSYVIEGNPEITTFLLQDVLKKRGDIKEDKKDIFFEIYDSLSIEDTRIIKDWHSHKGESDSKRFCIIGAKFINHEAERALLKIIEEPQRGTHFFLIVPNSQMLLDTILSRVHVIKSKEEKKNSTEIDAKTFFTSKPKERIEIIASIIDDSKDNENSGGLRHISTCLINDLERIIYEKFKNDKEKENNIFILDQLNKAREYLSLSGSSPKMILEHIALVL